MFARRAKDLVNGVGDFVAAQGRDHALDLAPVAEAGDIAVVAAAFGAHRRLEARIVTIALDQLGGVAQGATPMDERTIHAAKLSGAAFPDCGRSSSTCH